MNAIEFANNPDSSKASFLQPTDGNSKRQELERQQAREATLDWISHSALEKFQHNWGH